MLTDEPELVAQLQEDYVNFYAPATVNPYIALAARGALDRYLTWCCCPR